MSAAAPDPDDDDEKRREREGSQAAAARQAISVYLLAEADGERRCDGCGRLPRARRGCYAAVKIGFFYGECRTCAALLRRAVGALE